VTRVRGIVRIVVVVLAVGAAASLLFGSGLRGRSARSAGPPILAGLGQRPPARAAAQATVAQAPAAKATVAQAPAAQAPAAQAPAVPPASIHGAKQQVAGGRAERASAPAEDPTDRVAGWTRAPYFYASLGRRDPFASLLEGEYTAEGEVGLPDVADLKLVGIAWDVKDHYAMVEDGRGFGYVLREGDPVRSGRVLRIGRESVTFAQNMAGESTTVTIELPIREGD
jgi:hypothetical protein